MDYHGLELFLCSFLCTVYYIFNPLLAVFLPARKRGNGYGNVAGWVAGCRSQPVLYQND